MKIKTIVTFMLFSVSNLSIAQSAMEVEEENFNNAHPVTLEALPRVEKGEDLKKLFGWTCQGVYPDQPNTYVEDKKIPLHFRFKYTGRDRSDLPMSGAWVEFVGLLDMSSMPEDAPEYVLGVDKIIETARKHKVKVTRTPDLKQTVLYEEDKVQVLTYRKKDGIIYEKGVLTNSQGKSIQWFRYCSKQ